MFLNSINIARAVIIVFVVLEHCLIALNLSHNGFFVSTIQNLFWGGTYPFIFISGYMFHHVFAKNYDFWKFLKSRFMRVFMPYLFVGTPLLILFMARGMEYWNRVADYNFGSLPYPALGAFSYAFLTGNFIIAYWYVPFAMIVFVMSPLHIRFLKLSTHAQLAIIACLSVVSLFLHRPSQLMYFFQAPIYFLPIYYLGCFVSIHRDMVISYFKGKEIYLIGGALFFAATQAYTGHVGNYHKPPFEWGGVDLMFPQKIFLALFIVVYLDRFESFHSRIVNIVAETSFSIYFLHVYFILFLQWFFFGNQFGDLRKWAIASICAVFIVLISAAIAFALKFLTPKYSRYMVGT